MICKYSPNDLKIYIYKGVYIGIIKSEGEP